jgi:hypothetical protein
MAQLTPWKQRMRLVSDGTGPGTKLFDTDGNEVKLDRCRCVAWAVDEKTKLGILKAEFFAVEIDAEGGLIR